MFEKENEIIEEIEKLDVVKKTRELINKIKDNDEYILLMNEFNKNKKYFEENGLLKEKIIELRKKLFSISEVKEYMSLSNDIRLLSIRISKIISSTISESNCLY